MRSRGGGALSAIKKLESRKSLEPLKKVFRKVQRSRCGGPVPAAAREKKKSIFIEKAQKKECEKAKREKGGRPRPQGGQ